MWNSNTVTIGIFPFNIYALRSLTQIALQKKPLSQICVFVSSIPQHVLHEHTMTFWFNETLIEHVPYRTRLGSFKYYSNETTTLL